MLYMFSMNLVIAYVFLSFPVCTAFVHQKPSLFEEFSTFKEISLSIFDDLNNHVKTSFDAKSGAPIPRLRVEFEYLGDPLILNLKLNKALLLPRYIEQVPDVTVRTPYNSNSFCYYVGHVSRARNASTTDEGTVAASTCSGLKAFIVLPDDVLHVEPTNERLDGKHLLFRESEASKKFNVFETIKGESSRFILPRHQNKKMSRTMRMKRAVKWPYDTNNETLIVELFVVNDNSQFISQGRDVEAVIKRTISIVNIVNSLFRSLNIYVALVGVEVWSDADRIQTMDTSEGTMNKFLEYRRRYINSNYVNDNAQMISSRSFGEGVVGKAPIMTMCSWQYSGGINLDHSHLVGRIATTVAHEMGHNFGMTHDTEESKCPEEKCIMSPSSGGSINPTKWSNVSKEQLSDALAQGMHHCLHNIPSKLFGDQPVCGDGFVDKGEECDCGLPKDCTSTCCNATTCTLLSHAKCSSGNCCDLSTCQLRPMTHECRPVKGDCDLAEYCDGSSEFCPFDIFKHNGYPCHVAKTESYCFNGQCRTHETQCKLLWGRTGRSSHPLCYSKLNVKGGIEGNCGLNLTDGKVYLKCQANDIMCGMLHCEHESEKLMFWKESLSFELPDSSIFVDGKRYNCKAAILDVGLDSDNPGLAPDGSKCGENMMCVSQRCISTEEVLAQLNCPDCNGNGICSSLSQCHCNPGWAPPNCDKFGGGGSLHSNSIEVHKDNIGLTVALGFMFGILFPCFLICIIYIYRQRNLLLKKIGLDSYNSIRAPTKPPPRPSAEQKPANVPPSKTLNSSRRPLPPPFKPPSPPQRELPVQNHLNEEEKYRLPPRLPPKTRLVSSLSCRPHERPPLPGVGSAGLREALSELQQINFLKDDDNPDFENGNDLDEVLDKNIKVHEQRRLVPFRKAPPPPPPGEHGVRRSISLKPPERPPPPPKHHQV